MRILLAEDDPLLGDGLRAGLRQRGFQVDWVRDGLAAERELRAEPYAAAVLDLGLPLQDGLDALGAVRRAGVPVPVLVLTARDTVPDRVRGLDGGADDYVVKPVDLDELAARLHLAGGRHRQRVDEFDLLRVLVGRQLPAHMLLQRTHQGVVAHLPWRQHDISLDHRAAVGIGLGHHHGIGHRRVLDEAILDLARADAVAGGLEDVVAAALVPEVAVVVHHRGVAGAAP